MKYDFDHTPERRESESFKWQTYPEDVVPMFVADMDFVSPEPVIDALVARAQHGVYGYPRGLLGKPSELSELREAVLAHLKFNYGWTIPADALVFIPGVVTALHLACHAFVGSNSGVLIQTPVYPPILHAGQTTGVLSQEMELSLQNDGSYVIDLDKFEASITDQTRMFVLCNPHNPVGRVFRRDELLPLAEICLRRDVLICSDEIHGDLIFGGHQHIPIASLDPEIAQKTITLIAPSKTYNLAGLQCSIAIIPDSDMRNRFMAARKGLVSWVNLMGLVAAQVAYQEGCEWLEQLLVYLEENRNVLCEFVEKNLKGIRVASPEGTYLAWLDCRAAAIEGDPYKFFLEKAKVALNDGKSFGKGGDGFARLNFGCSRATLLEGLSRMEEALLKSIKA